MKSLYKNITWIFSGIGVAIMLLIYNLTIDNSVAADGAKREQSISGVNAGRDVTIIQLQPSNTDNLGKPLETQKDIFIGALDGEYTNKDNGMIANADYDRKEVSFIAGNCEFTSVLKQNGDSWDLYLKETDGICSFLRELKIGKRVMRLIPVPGAMANSGRVLKFVAQSGEYPINNFFGTYVLK